MASIMTESCFIAGIRTCVPARSSDNLYDNTAFSPAEIRKVVAMAGVRNRRIADDSVCSSDLCVDAAKNLMNDIGWDPVSVDGIIVITQTPDYFLPQTSAVIHKALGLSEGCATIDLGLGCSGYPYGLWLAAMMLHSGGIRRILLLHGETPSRYSREADRSVSLLFGDAGSATAIESQGSSVDKWHFIMATDSSGLDDMIIEGGGFRNRFPEEEDKYYVRMNGANVFNFTLKRIPPLVRDTIAFSGLQADDVDYYIFHQSNQFIMKHLVKKLGIPEARAPIILKDFGNTGGCSIPLAITQGNLGRHPDRSLRLMLIGYGVGLSWSAALVDLRPDAVIAHGERV